jgi:hypothetical protein
MSNSNDDEKDDDLEMADELAQTPDADEIIKLPNTPFPEEDDDE